MTMIFRIFAVLLSLAGFFVALAFIGGQWHTLKNPHELIWWLVILFMGWLLFFTLSVANYMDKRLEKEEKKD